MLTLRTSTLAVALALGAGTAGAQTPHAASDAHVGHTSEHVADELAAAHDEGIASSVPMSAGAASVTPKGAKASKPSALTTTSSPNALGDPEVRRGRVVQLVLRTGGIRVVRVGIALADGRQGQSIPVRVQGMAPVLARVSGVGQVELDV